MTATAEARRLAEIAAAAAAEKLGDEIVAIDVSDRLAISDVFVIASAANERQVMAVVDEVTEKLRDAGRSPLRREGYHEARWVLVDYSDIVVHVMHREDREFYGLERLWKDCPRLDVAVTASAPGDEG